MILHADVKPEMWDAKAQIRRCSSRVKHDGMRLRCHLGSTHYGDHEAGIVGRSRSRSWTLTVNWKNLKKGR